MAIYYIKGQRPSQSVDGWMNIISDVYDGQMIARDECGPNFLICVYSWGKTPKKTSTRKLTRSEIEPGSAAWSLVGNRLESTVNIKCQILFIWTFVFNILAMHLSALWQRLCPYCICFLDVYLVCHGVGFTAKRRQPLWTSVQNSESMHFQTHVFSFLFIFLSCFDGYYHLSKYLTLF